jgi:molybdenum cofactor synthesis domain-containing protein
MTMWAKVITVSDSLSAGTGEDRSGPAVAAALETAGFAVVERELVPDGVDAVAGAIRSLAAGFQGVLATTGGTGFAPTDLTPEGTRLVLDREAPGLAEAMRATSHLGALSRGLAGTVGTCLVINLPGSVKGATECLAAIVDLLPHAVDLLCGGHPH